MSKRKAEPNEGKGKTLLQFFTKLPTQSKKGESKDGESSEPANKQMCSGKTSEIKKNSEKVDDHKFQTGWLEKFEWLSYDEKKNLMFCNVCVKHNKSNTFVKGCSNFRTSTLTRHASGTDHQSSIESVPMKQAMQQQSKQIFDAKEKAIVNCLKTVYYIVKGDLPLVKYESMVSFLTELEVPDMDKVKIDKHTTYSSVTTANGMLS